MEAQFNNQISDVLGLIRHAGSFILVVRQERGFKMLPSIYRQTPLAHTAAGACFFLSG